MRRPFSSAHAALKETMRAKRSLETMTVVESTGTVGTVVTVDTHALQLLRLVRRRTLVLQHVDSAHVACAQSADAQHTGVVPCACTSVATQTESCGAHPRHGAV